MSLSLILFIFDILWLTGRTDFPKNYLIKLSIEINFQDEICLT